MSAYRRRIMMRFLELEEKENQGENDAIYSIKPMGFIYI